MLTILMKFYNTALELQLVRFGVDATKARIKTNFITRSATKTRDTRTMGCFNGSVGSSLQVYILSQTERQRVSDGAVLPILSGCESSGEAIGAAVATIGRFRQP